jgi:N-acetylglucosamine-6-phosphate deacetylase
MTTPEIIEKLVNAGVVVSAGHTNATFAEIETALRHGLTGFTHLFNAMSQLTGREPGVVGAALDDQKSWCGIIVDGEHTDPVVLRIALRCKPHNRFMLVTDAMPSVGTNQTSFNLQGRKITVSGLVCVDEDGRLAGSNIDMASCVRNAVKLLNLPLLEAVGMASRNPAEFLGLAHDTGRIRAAYRANLVLADEELNVLETWIDGRSSAEP